MDFWRYMFGPQLYMEYGEETDEMYTIALTERIGDYILTFSALLWKLSLYTSPVTLAIFYIRNYLIKKIFAIWLKFSAIIGLILLFAILLRAVGRFQSGSYHSLMDALKKAKLRTRASESRHILSMFDFDFRWWPVDFDVGKLNKQQHQRKSLSSLEVKEKFDFKLLPRYAAAYILIHTIGIRLLYPGSIVLLQSYLRPSLVSGRAKLIQERNAKRFKVKTIDRNEIDTLFIDNRNKGRKGNVLLLTCEGNLGFYEIGLMGQPVAREFSMLGWNHPGFAGSSGRPYPNQEFNAIDAVMQFAIERLNFNVDNILLYGWSIGGFAALCGASKYQLLRGVILDATFDDILHLALPRMPTFLSEIVEMTVRRHCNLSNKTLIKQYSGPIFLIRRTFDETIAWNSRISANRGNYLILTLLQHRYPKIFRSPQLALMEFILAKPLNQTVGIESDDDYLQALLIAHIAAKGYSYPMQIGEDYSERLRDDMAEFLLRRHCCDFRSTHCTLLPLEHFHIAWENITKSWNYKL